MAVSGLRVRRFAGRFCTPGSVTCDQPWKYTTLFPDLLTVPKALSMGPKATGVAPPRKLNVSPAEKPVNPVGTPACNPRGTPENLLKINPVSHFSTSWEIRPPRDARNFLPGPKGSS